MKGSRWRFLLMFPAISTAAISHIAICPACWPLVGGIMSGTGLSSLLEGPLMPPLFIGSLLLALVPLGLGVRRHIGPLLCGSAAFLMALSGRFLFDLLGLRLGGIALLTGAYLWSYRLYRRNHSTCTVCDVPRSKSEEQISRDAEPDVPIACALDKTQFAERKALLDRMIRASVECKTVPGGFALCFGSHPGLLAQLANFVELERACCPFLSFKIVANTKGRIWLELTGPTRAKEILSELIPATEIPGMEVP
jgi:hypothetical protein